MRLKGAPTISFRDLKLHRRDDDLVGATFGRGFYILDDYAPLRGLAAAVGAGESTLFPARDAWWYIPSVPAQAPGRPTQGSTAYVADNPPFGAVLTYFLTRTSRRRGRSAAPGRSRPANGATTSRSPASTPCARRAWRRLRRSSW